MSYSEYSDYSGTESDEEYAPLQIAGWGTQKINKEGTTEVSVSMDGWASLIDPTVQIKSNGIGTGQLHRQGRNFKPIDEQLILDQRLGKPLPKGGLNGEKKKKKKKKSKSGQSPPPPQQQQQQSRAPKPLKFAPNRGRPPIQPGSSAWATDKLVETPFWEQPNGTSASKYATPSVQPPQQQPPPQQPPQQPPQRQLGQQPPQQQWGQQSQHQSQQQPLGTMASKYATPVPAQPSTPAQTCQYQQQQQLFMPADPVKTPCLTFKIELAPGVTANLPVYANDNPLDVVNQFEKNHQLVMTEAAKSRFAERVAMLLSQYDK
ncbi:hypothetical protein G6F70_001600 [Rhizopus microsporus]|uniref:Uncharacterized protein n=2 Tax=Rhizopus TaxID=4842 RepID=A0A367KCE3_RHIAZ|nr:hypothetical protein G6F71_001586 [Rhizopus microsporus]RCH99846.1 hypothetical protein CU097_015186 [Rhizopus azygosporus]KAG1203178.1 hypothetical protein G6F70_001600 [Rhizopus microsporus]KAG1214396.1 hypothetical protein G6F69_001948 [Rhizopus microsporus]KAG1237896.1 hypothetical protein G6F67_000826 [Rhizopus microsporus]